MGYVGQLGGVVTHMGVICPLPGAPMNKTAMTRRRTLAGDVLPSAPMPDTELLRRSFIPWLDLVDARVGRDARVDLGRSYSWLAAWSEGLTPAEAITEAIEWLQVRP